VKAKGTGQFVEQSADTIIFAIGDKVSGNLGLPMQGNEYAKNPAPAFPIEGTSYEICDPIHPENTQGIFVAGWSRKASSGLVGQARKDGTFAARSVLTYLRFTRNIFDGPCEDPGNARPKGYTAVTAAEIAVLEAAEKAEAVKQSLPEYKFDSNEEMLQVMKVR
jgi:ferredoxin--NADP+ reductase